MERMQIHVHFHPALKFLAVAALDPLELLDTDQAVIAINSQSKDQLIPTIHFPH